MHTKIHRPDRTTAMLSCGAALAWTILASMGLGGNSNVLFLGTAILVSVALTSITVYRVSDMIGHQSKGARQGVAVVALLAPAVVTPALMPLIAAVGAAILAYVAFAFALEFLVLGLIFARKANNVSKSNRRAVDVTS